MKKKKFLFGLLTVLLCGFSSVVSAAEVQTVKLTADNQIVYADSTEKLQTAFEGMAPGDTRTVAIRLQNDNSHTASFFISQETTDILEEVNKSSGGAYEFGLKVGKSEQEAASLLDASAGGYTGSMDASTTGLSDITELQDFRYVAELAAGDYTNVYVTLTLDGEGMDSANGIDYSRATGQLQFQFRAYYADDRQPVIVTKYVEEKEPDKVVKKVIDKIIPVSIQNQIVPLAHGVKTGDPTSIGILLAILAAGVAIVAVAVKKRKVEKQA